MVFRHVLRDTTLGQVQTPRILEELSFVHTAEWYSINSYSEFCLVKFSSIMLVKI